MRGSGGGEQGRGGEDYQADHREGGACAGGVGEQAAALNAIFAAATAAAARRRVRVIPAPWVVPARIGSPGRMTRLVTGRPKPITTPAVTPATTRPPVSLVPQLSMGLSGVMIAKRLAVL